MLFEWDNRKNVGNQEKHGISFETAQLVFNDPYQLSIQDRHVDGEERWQTIGEISGITIVIVAHTFRERDGEEVIRLISARQATKQERQRYEQAKFD